MIIIRRAWDLYQRLWYWLCDFVRTPAGFGLLIMAWAWLICAAIGGIR